MLHFVPGNSGNLQSTTKSDSFILQHKYLNIRYHSRLEYDYLHSVIFFKKLVGCSQIPAIAISGLEKCQENLPTVGRNFH